MVGIDVGFCDNLLALVAHLGEDLPSFIVLLLLKKRLNLLVKMSLCGRLFD